MISEKFACAPEGVSYLNSSSHVCNSSFHGERSHSINTNYQLLGPFLLYGLIHALCLRWPMAAPQNTFL